MPPEQETAEEDVAPCRWCGSPTGHEPCPIVSAFEFYPDGTTIRRVEYKSEDTKMHGKIDEVLRMLRAIRKENGNGQQ
jgi:hypothetical protein